MIHVARATIIIPIFVILVSLFFFSQSKLQAFQAKKALLAKPTSIPVSPTTSAKETMKINLSGPLSCSYTDSTSMVSARLKNKNLLVARTEQMKLTNYLVNGDCLYTWGGENQPGKKMCGIGQYVSILDTLSNFGLLDVSSIMGNLSQFGLKSDTLPSEDVIASVLKNCKKESIGDSVFTIPSTIQFTSENLPIK